MFSSYFPYTSLFLFFFSFKGKRLARLILRRSTFLISQTISLSPLSTQLLLPTPPPILLSTRGFSRRVSDALPVCCVRLFPGLSPVVATSWRILYIHTPPFRPPVNQTQRSSLSIRTAHNTNPTSLSLSHILYIYTSSHYHCVCAAQRNWIVILFSKAICKCYQKFSGLRLCTVPIARACRVALCDATAREELLPLSLSRRLLSYIIAPLSRATPVCTFSRKTFSIGRTLVGFFFFYFSKHASARM